MNPWWKRPSSESSSTASREADRRTQPDQDSGSSDGNSRGRGGRRRGGRRGAADGDKPRRAENASPARSESAPRDNSARGGGRGRGSRGGSQRSNEGGSSRRGGRRRGGRGRRGTNTTIALLVDVEALHSSLKASGRKPEDAADIFANVGEGVARRAVACATRKQKVRSALKGAGFDVEQVNGAGAEAARLRLALDAMELALAHRGAKIYLFDGTVADPASEGEAASAGPQENAVLAERLRHHGAEVTYFSLTETLSIGEKARSRDDANKADAGPDRAEDNGDGEAGAPDAEAGDNESPTGRRRRRSGRRGRGADRDSKGGDSATDSEPVSADAPPQAKPARAPARKSTSDPLTLLTSAIGKLMQGESQLVWATKARQEMSSLDPLFNETENGYENFEALLREAERRGRIVLQKDPRTQTFVIVGWRAA